MISTFEGKYDFDWSSPLCLGPVRGQPVFLHEGFAQTFDKGKLNDYVLLNVKLSQRFFDNRFTTYFGVNNIFDENYETSYGFPRRAASSADRTAHLTAVTLARE